jgi:hypothetical protein
MNLFTENIGSTSSAGDLAPVVKKLCKFSSQSGGKVKQKMRKTQRSHVGECGQM